MSEHSVKAGFDPKELQVGDEYEGGVSGRAWRVLFVDEQVALVKPLSINTRSPITDEAYEVCILKTKTGRDITRVVRGGVQIWPMPKWVPEECDVVMHGQRVCVVTRVYHPTHGTMVNVQGVGRLSGSFEINAGVPVADLKPYVAPVEAIRAAIETWGCGWANEDADELAIQLTKAIDEIAKRFILIEKGK